MLITEACLARIVDEVEPFLSQGAVSEYLPQLAQAGVKELAVSVAFESGGVVSAGDRGLDFSMQSTIKLFTLLLALHDRGESYVFERVDRDPTVGAFNSFETVGKTSGVPVNPFVNSGALAVVDMLKGNDSVQKVDRVMSLVRGLTGNPGIVVNRELANSEYRASDRNRALCYYLRSCGLVSGDVEELLWAYCQLCSIEVSVVDLAQAGRRLADEFGLGSIENTPQASVVRMIRRLTLTTGMYLASGVYSSQVGIPAKCGVSGAMIGIVPGVCGIGIYGPSLDAASNSVGGIRVMQLLSDELGVR